MCKLLNISRQTYYRHKNYKYLESKIKKSYSQIDKLVINEFYSNYKRYGADKISIVLRRKNYRVSKYKVLKSMKRQNLVCLYNKSKRYKQFHYNKADISNIVDRRFNAGGILSSDLTYIKLGRKFYYLCFIVDTNTREILSHSFSKYKDSQIVINALSKVDLRKYKVFHTDRGSEFVNFDIDNILKENKIIRSLSKAGCPYDNAISENVFNIFKRELEYSRDDDVLLFKKKVSKYIDWYNNVRIQRNLDNKSPVEYRYSM